MYREAAAGFDQEEAADESAVQPAHTVSGTIHTKAERSAEEKTAAAAAAGKYVYKCPGLPVREQKPLQAMPEVCFYADSFLSASPCHSQHVQLLTQIQLLTSPVAKLHSEAETTRQFLVTHFILFKRNTSFWKVC